MTWLKEIYKLFFSAPALTVILFLSCAFAVSQSVMARYGEWDTSLALMLLAVFFAYLALKNTVSAGLRQGDRISGTVLLLMAYALMFLGKKHHEILLQNTALALGAASSVVFCCGLKAVPRSILFLFTAFIILPFQERWLLLISYPLRRIATELSVALFQLFGVSIHSVLTTIYIGKAEVAVTDACSGISQLGVLIFFAALLSEKLRGAWYLKVLWAALLLPIVIVSNGVRLILTIGLYMLVGERAFENDIHTGLGYFFVLLTLVLLWAILRLLAPGGAEDEK